MLLQSLLFCSLNNPSFPSLSSGEVLHPPSWPSLALPSWPSTFYPNMSLVLPKTLNSLRPSSTTSNSRLVKLSMRNMQLSTPLLQSELRRLLTETRSTSHASFPLRYFTKCLSGAQPGAPSKKVATVRLKMKTNYSSGSDSTYMSQQNKARAN